MAEALLPREVQTFIAGGGAIVHDPDRRIELPERRVLQIQRPPLVLVGGARERKSSARGIYRAPGRRRGVPRSEDGGVDIFATDEVNGAASDVVGGYQPVLAELPLNAEVPLVHISRVEIAQRRKHVGAK